jgi:protein-tyrosine phosphatase
MIDIHCHLLPGIDDGPRNWEQSIDLCRAMTDNGIRTAVATPHLIDGIYENTLSRVEPLTLELNERLADADIALKVLPGAEVDISSRYLTAPSVDLPRLGGGAGPVLLEMPMAVIPHAMAAIIFTARSQGMIPILAHPERNEPLQERSSIAASWIDAGAVLQLDGDSLLGIWGKATKYCAIELLERGQFHAMASDAHSCVKRPPRLRQSLEKAIELVGQEATTLVTEGPRMLLAGRAPTTPLYTADPPLRRRSFSRLFDRLRGR